MPFNLRLFLKVHRRALRDALGPSWAPAWLRRILYPVLVAGWCTLGLVHRVCLRLDDLVFPGYRDAEIRRPVFVVGVQRSGTTFLHRLLARDQDRFTTMQTWEIFLAPSVIQKRVLRGVGLLDVALGAPLYRLYRRLRDSFRDSLHGIHHVDLFEPEEDEYLNTWCFASLFLGEVFPYHDLIGPYAFFDEEIPLPERQALMNFYEGCVRRHLYALGAGRRFLSKNPSFCGKLISLRETFPDAEILVTVRTPLETVPSYLSFLEAMGDGIESPPVNARSRVEETLQVLDHFNRRPLELVDTLFADRSYLVLYPRLLQRLEEVVGEIYLQLDVPLEGEFAAHVQQQAVRSRNHESGHRYSLERFGLNRGEIVSRYRHLFDRFSFDTGEDQA